MKNVLIIISLFFALVPISPVFSQETNAAGDKTDKDSVSIVTENPESNVSKEETETGPEEMYLNFNYAGLVSTLFTCYYNGENTYIPVQQFFNSLQINNTQTGNRISGYYMYSGREYMIDLDSREITFNGQTTRFSKSDAFISDEGEIFISPTVLSAAFNMEIVVDLSQLSLGLYTEENTPLEARAKRESLREALLEDETTTKETPLLFKRTKNWLKGEFIDYFFSSSMSEGSYPNYSYSINSGSELMGGDLNINLSGSESHDHNDFDYDINWRYVFGKEKLLNQVLLGSKLQSKGIDPHSFTGVSLTNAPFEVEGNFGSYVLVDKTVPLSDVELYINNQMVAYTRADDLGNYQFNIPMTYGSNTIELKIYSPDGQLIENNRRIQVPFDYLPKGDFQYYLNFGQQNDTKDMMYHGSLGYGITSWLTDRAGVDFTSTDGVVFNNPVFFNSLSGRVMDDYLFNYTFAPELYHRVSISASYFDLQSFSLKYTKYKQNKVYNVRNLEEDFEITSGIPVNIMDIKAGVQGQALYEKTIDSKHYKLDVGANFSMLNFSPSINYAYSEEQSQYSTGVRREIRFGLSTPATFLNGIFPELMSGKYFSTVVKYDAVNNQFANAKLTYSSNLTRNARIEFNYSNDLQYNFSSFNVVFKYEFPFAVTNTIVDDKSLIMNVHGTVGYDNANKNIFTTKRQSVGTGGVAFKMFQDENGNGKYDKGEPMVDDIDLKFNQNVQLDRNDDGVLIASELTPYREYNVEINPLSGKNPFLQPKFQKFGLVTDPNQIKLVEIPFYFSQEVYGNVVAVKDGAEIPLPSVKIHIQNHENDEEKVITSFNDGTLYYLGLLPGDYTAYVDSAMVEMLGAETEPDKIDFTIYDENDDKEIKELNFVLKLDNSTISNIDEQEIASFRAKFLYTEKRINSRVGTHDEAHKEFFDEISASQYTALPEFAERYEKMKTNLEQWESETVEKGEDTGYTVVKGDCLWKIAGMKKHYDNPHLWPAIWEANKDGIISAPEGVKTTITNPNLIYPRQVLKIPHLSDEQKQEFLNIEGQYYDKKGRGKPREK